MKPFLIAFALSVPAIVQAQSTSMATVKVNGLVCDFCVQALTKTFRKQPAVRSFHVDLDAKELHIGFNAGKTLDDAAIRALVTDAGYNVVGIARTGA